MKKYLWLFILTLLTVLWFPVTPSAGPDSERNSPDNPLHQPVQNPSEQQVVLGPHPRLFFPGGQEAEILRKAESNPLLAGLIDMLKAEADKKLELPLQKFLGDGKMLHPSREQIARNLILSMAWRLFREEKYVRRVEEELLNVCGFENWSPGHFLDVAEMTTAVSIGYDWCYDFLSPETRKTVEDAIVEKAFGPAWPIYERQGKTPFSRENNWNTVCNAGMVNGAIAIGDKYPEMMDRIVKYAVEYTPNVFVSFAPEGVFNEGPGYWAYNAMFMAPLFDNLFRHYGHDFGLSSFEGMDNTARYYIEQIGPAKQSFNFGDASEPVDKSGTFFYLSRRYKQPDVALHYRNLIRDDIREFREGGSPRLPRFYFLAIPWFDDAEPGAAHVTKKLTVFQGVTDLLVFNGKEKSDPGRLYLIAKTGLPSWSHNQLDVGAFVVDYDGIRWGTDLGADSYSLPDFWDYKPYGVRWNYFRNTNMSHNTISIDGKITRSDGQGELVRFQTETPQPFGIFDMSAAYQDQAFSAKRGFMLLSPESILVRDQIELKPGAGEVSWRFVTEAEVSVAGNQVTLSQNGKQFFIQCLLQNGYRIQVLDAKPYTDREKPIHNVRIVDITVPVSGKTVAIPVVLTGKPGDSGHYHINNNDLDKWQ